MLIFSLFINNLPFQNIKTILIIFKYFKKIKKLDNELKK